MHLSQIASLEPRCDCIHQFEPLTIHTFNLKYDSVNQNCTSPEHELIVTFDLPRMHQHKKQLVKQLFTTTTLQLPNSTLDGCLKKKTICFVQFTRSERQIVNLLLEQLCTITLKYNNCTQLSVTTLWALHNHNPKHSSNEEPANLHTLEQVNLRKH